MTDALVFIEACTVCGRVQRTYVGRVSRRRTPPVCSECARPWIKWSCAECGSTSHEQVEKLPGRGHHFGTCAACDTETDKTSWTRSSREEALAQPQARFQRTVRLDS